MKNLFEYLETSTQQERDEIAESIIKLYFDAVKDLQETFARARDNRKSTKARQGYFESVQRYAGICDVLDALKIDIEQVEKGEGNL